MGISAERKPFKKVLSENVEIEYGWKDAHAVVHVRLPIPLKPWCKVQIPADAIVKFKTNFDDAYTYGIRPEAERTMKEPLEFEARDDCRGRYGYKDAHVELGIWRLVWVWLDFPFEEFKLAKAAMDEAYRWAELPESVRELQGV